jgi:tetratricopeptide (TPR) repeat protein
MLTDGRAIENVNAPLALRLIPLAEELGDLELIERLLDHAEKVSADELESGWVAFEQLKIVDSNKEKFVELAASSEKIENGGTLAAAVLHHIGLMCLSHENYDDCKVFITRSMRIREKSSDNSGLIYSLAVLEACDKRQNNLDSALVHGTRRLELLTNSDDIEGQMEALSDLAHTQASLGTFDAAIDLYTQSLELSNDLEDVSGQFVARWGLADLCEIQSDYKAAMIHLSDCLHSFIAFGIQPPVQIRERLEALTNLENPESN